MATQALHHGSKKLASSNSSLTPRAVISLLCAVSLYFCFSLFRKDAPPPSLFYPVVPAKSSGNCNYSDGRWIYDPSVITPPRYDHTCKEIFKGWNCIASNKSNAVEILKWRWKPHGCDLRTFDPLRFLEQFRDTSIGFVGDSLNRNMWWAPSKFDPVKSPMLFFEKGVPITPPLAPDAALDVVLRYMVSFVEKNARKNAILFFRTQSPRHFEGGDWDQGGSCPRIKPLAQREVEQLFSIEKNGTNVETRLVNEHLYRALKGSKFQILDITGMSGFRADAHPSAAGGKRHNDCMHWCLPGLTDTWNDLFISHLSSMRGSRH